MLQEERVTKYDLLSQLAKFSTTHPEYYSGIFAYWVQHPHFFSPPHSAHPLAGFSSSGKATASPILLSSPFCGRNFIIWQRHLHSFSPLHSVAGISSFGNGVSTPFPASPGSPICPFFCPIWTHYLARKLHILRVNCAENIRCMSHTMYQMPAAEIIRTFLFIVEMRGGGGGRA